MNVLNKAIKNRGLIYSIIVIIDLFVYILLGIFNKYSSSLSYGLLIIGIFFSVLCTYSYYKLILLNENEKKTDNLKKLKGIYQRDIKILSKDFRHDYMNIFQILYGCLQLRNHTRAIEYIKKTTTMSSNISKVYNLTIVSIALLLDKKIRKAYNEGIEIRTIVKKHIETEFRYAENEKFIVEKLDQIINYMIFEFRENEENNWIEININEYDNRLNLNIKADFGFETIGQIQRIYPIEKKASGELEVTFMVDKVTDIESEDSMILDIIKSI